MKTQRHLFDIPDDIAYFNCAYYSPQLNESRDRLLDGVKSKSHPWERTPPDFFSDAKTHLSALGFQLPESSQRSPHMFGAIIPGRYKGNLVSEMSRRKIYVSSEATRFDSLRICILLNMI